MKKVIVTGGAGFIGNNLIRSLRHRNYKVYSIDDYSTGKVANELRGVNYLKGDLSMIDEIDENFDICFHLAAKTLVQESFIDSENYLKVNTNGTHKVLEWAKKRKINVIYAGSASRHANPKSSPYALSKYFGEELCKIYRSKFDLNVSIARFYNVYGPKERVDEVSGNVIGIWRAKEKKCKPLTIVGDGNQKRDFIHVDDIVDGLIKISENDLGNNNDWELGSGVQYSINELFSFFKKRYPEITSQSILDQPGNFKSSARINDNMTIKLGWKPKDRLEKYITELD